MLHQCYCLAVVLLAHLSDVEAFMSIAAQQSLQNTAVRSTPRVLQAPAQAVTASARRSLLAMSNDQPSWSRRQWIASSAAIAAISCVSASRQAQAADQAPAPPAHAARETFTAKDGSYSFQYPSDFKSYSKLLKTHKEEVSMFRVSTFLDSYCCCYMLKKGS
jgi:hypothetical protein